MMLKSILISIYFLYYINFKVGYTQFFSNKKQKQEKYYFCLIPAVLSNLPESGTQVFTKRPITDQFIHPYLRGNSGWQ